MVHFYGGANIFSSLVDITFSNTIMADTFKFPNGGYDVTICRKQDILDCIDKNIIDKDIAMAIVEHCEFQAASFIKEGRWAGIPFIGNIRTPKTVQMLKTDEQQALIQDAKEQLGKEQYIMFRKQLNKENAKQISQDRYYRYVTSIAVHANKKLFRKLCDTKGEVYARLFLFCSREVVAISNEYINLEDYE